MKTIILIFFLMGCSYPQSLLLTMDDETFAPADLGASVLVWNDYLLSPNTITGSGISEWGDLSGNENDFVQTYDPYRPTITGDGIVFSGDALGTTTPTIDQPYTVYLVFRFDSFIGNSRVFNGTGEDAGVYCYVTDRYFGMQAGSTVLTDDGFYTIEDWYILRAVFDGASSSLRMNDDTPTVLNPGTISTTGFRLAARYYEDLFADMTVKAFLAVSGAVSDANDIKITEYFNKRFSIY